MSETFDAVLIGAGHNTLACALHLAARGWKVGVFEQAAKPGGAVRTGEYTVPGFHHDWAAMNLSLFAGSQFFKAYGPALMARGLELVPTTHPFASVFPDGRWLGVTTDMAQTQANIARFSSADAATWARLAAQFPADATHLFALLGSPMKIRAFASILWRLMRQRGISGAQDLGKFLLSSPRAWLEDTFESPHLRATLGAWGLHLDYAPDVAGGALFPYLEGMAGQAFGMVLAKGGAGRAISALVAEISARGGHVECNAPVARIVQSGGTATGIELADGRQIMARKAVIAGVAPKGLMQLTGGTGDATFDTAMTGYRHAPGTMMIHLALDALPPWAAGPDLHRYAYVHLAPSLDQMARTYQQAQAGLLPDEPALVVGQPTVVDPSRAPAGQHVLWVQVRMVPGTIQGDAAGQITATDWAGAAQPMADRVLAMLERYAPGLTGHILGQRIVTPAELEADNPNLVGGDQICGSHHLSQHFLYRPARGRTDGSTPLRNLHLTGAAVWPGAGTGAGPGWLLAQKLAGG